MRLRTLITLIVVIAILGGLGYSLYVTLQSGAKSAGIVTCVDDGTCFWTAHLHAYVPITVCGEEYRLPIEKGSLTKAHTHEEENIIHWHDRLPYDKEQNALVDSTPFTLHAFFEEIGVPFGEDLINEYRNGALCPDGSVGMLKMFVNGVHSTLYEVYEWRDHDVISLFFDARSVEEIEAELKAQPVAFPALGRG